MAARGIGAPVAGKLAARAGLSKGLVAVPLASDRPLLGGVVALEAGPRALLGHESARAGGRGRSWRRICGRRNRGTASGPREPTGRFAFFSHGSCYPPGIVHAPAPPPVPAALPGPSPSGLSPGPALSAPRESDVRAVLSSARSARRRRWLKLLVPTLVALAALAAIAYRAKTGGNQPKLELVTEPSRRGPLHATVTATGSLEALDQVQVGAELSGRVTRVHVDFNDRVEQGQVLCELDDSEWRARVEQASAQLHANQATVESAVAAELEARLNAERSVLLAREGLLSEQALEAAQAAARRALSAVEVARSQVRLSRAALDSARTSLSKTRVLSPISGIVLSRAVEPGQTVAASFQAPVLFTLARDLRQMELHIQIDEADVGRVAEHQSASFSVDAHPGRSFAAELASIHNVATVQNAVVSYDAVLFVENQDLSLRPGMTATVTIVTAHRDDALLVPNAALRFVPPSALPRSERGGPPNPFAPRRPRQGQRTDRPADDARPTVWTLGADGEPRPLRLRTGLSDGEWTEVLDGPLEAGQPLLVDAVQRGG